MTEILCLSSKARSLISSFCQGLDPSEDIRGSLCQAALSIWWFSAIFSVLLVVDASPHSLPSSSHGIVLVCVSVSKSHLFIGTLVTLDCGPTNDFILTSPCTTTLFSNKVTFQDNGG